MSNSPKQHLGAHVGSVPTSQELGLNKPKDSTLVKQMFEEIDAQSHCTDGFVVIPGYLYEQLKQTLGIAFKPHYTEAV